MFKFKVGDTVKIIIGKDKGREGKIEKIFPKSGKVLIPGINIYKKHIKSTATTKGDRKGGIYEIPRPIGVSKISIICSRCKKNTRLGFRFVGQNKVRVCKKCNREIDIKQK